MNETGEPDSIPDTGRIAGHSHRTVTPLPREEIPPHTLAELVRLEYGYALDKEDRRLAEKSLEMEDRRATRGQWLAFTLAMLFLGVLLAAVLTDAHLVAAGLMGSGIAVGVGSFIYSHRQQQPTVPGNHNRRSAPANPAPETS